jgi:HEAT repeat protein
MVVSAWQKERPSEEHQEKYYERLPIWIDLEQIAQLERDPEAHPAEQLAQLAVLFMPQLLTKWIVQHLENGPSLILLDNWSSLSAEDKQEVADWIEVATQDFDDPFWLVAAGETGYGALTEIGFVPAAIVPQPHSAWLSQIITGWADDMESDIAGGELADDESSGPDRSTLLDTLHQTLGNNAPLWEFHLQAALFFRTGATAETPHDAIERWIQEEIPIPTLGDEEEDFVAAELAQQLAREVLLELAGKIRLEGQTIDTREMRELVQAMLPDEEERHPKLESTVQRLLVDASFVKSQSNRTWTFSHPIWTDYFTACYLLDTDEGYEVILDHIFDPTWSRIVGFYTTQVNASEIVKELLRANATLPRIDRLLRASRWAVNTPPETPWRRTLMRALAQSFMDETLGPSHRLIIGRALAQVAGEGARAFFLKMLQRPSLEIRVAALRGLGWCENPQDMRILGAAIRDQNFDIRSAAVRSLRDMGTPGAAKFLGKSLDQVDEALMLVIAEALSELPDGPQALIDATDHPDLLVRRAVAQGLGNIDEEWAEKTLIDMLKQDPEWLVRSAAESALEAREDQEAEQATIPPPPQIDEIEWLISWAAEQGMGLGLGDAAIETLVMAAQEGRDDVKILSALTLTRIGQASHIPILESMIEDDASESVRMTAMQGLQELRRRYPDTYPKIDDR